MSGVYYLLFGIAILAIIWWCIQNDKGSESDGAKGLLAMRRPKETRPANRAKPSRNGRLNATPPDQIRR